MQIIPQFDPGNTALYPDGNGVIDVGAADAGSKALFYNESPFNINLDFYNGNQGLLHAWEARYWSLDGDTKQIGWSLATSLNVVNPPISVVMGELYGPHERLEGTYPVALIRQIGGQQAIVSGSSTLVNTNSPINTTDIIQISPAGDAGSVTTLDNMGNFVNGDATHPGTFSLDNAKITTDGAGNITVTGSVKTNTIFDTSGDGVIGVTGSGATQNTRLQSAGSINLQVPAGTSQAIVDSTGFTVGPGQLHLVVGDLRHLNGTVSTIGSGTVISHGLGITPRFVLLTSNIAQPGSSNVGVGSFTATTFTASVAAGTSGCWYAVKE